MQILRYITALAAGLAIGSMLLLVGTASADSTAALAAAANRELHVTPANKDGIRKRLRRVVYGGNAPGHTVPLKRTHEHDHIRYARAVYALDMQLAEGMHARPLLFRTAKPSKRRLVIYHAGHERPVYESSRMQIEFFLARGYDVAAFSMPLMEFNAPQWLYDHPVCGPRLVPHEVLECLKRPLRPFLAPVAITLNTLANRYRSVDMAGFSGGGWTTVVAAAIDRRIRRSYPIAGSWPMYLMRWSGAPRADLEFRYRPMLKAASYLDMYALSHNQLAIWIEANDCCFVGPAYRTFMPAVRAANPRFRARLDTVARKHEVSRWALRVIVRDMLR